MPSKQSIAETAVLAALFDASSVVDSAISLANVQVVKKGNETVVREVINACVKNVEILATVAAAARCTSRWHRGVVTGAHGSAGVEVNGIPRHVADVRVVLGSSRSSSSSSSDGEACDKSSAQEVNERPQRKKRMPCRFRDVTL